MPSYFHDDIGAFIGEGEKYSIYHFKIFNDQNNVHQLIFASFLKSFFFFFRCEST